MASLDTLLESLERYVKYGIPTGSFSQSVLENDLSGAFGNSDGESENHLRALLTYLYNDVPNICHGSPERVREWLARDWSKERGDDARTV